MLFLKARERSGHIGQDWLYHRCTYRGPRPGSCFDDKQNEDGFAKSEATAIHEQGAVAVRILKEFFSERFASDNTSQANPSQRKDKV